MTKRLGERRVVSRSQLWWGLLLSLLGLLILSSTGFSATQKPIEVKLNNLWQGQSLGVSPDDPLVRLMMDDKTIAVKEWSGISIPGGAGRVPLMMSFAGQTAPDLYYSWFHIIRTDVKQGFAYPLNQWIGYDKDGDGQISPEEATWKEWKDIPAINRYVATVGGKIYGIPSPTTYSMGIIFRTDMVRAAGLNPDNPPKTWDEFFYWCQKITDKKRNIKAFALPVYGFTWLAWLYSSGGTPVMQTKIDPANGKAYQFPIEVTDFITPDTKHDLAKVRPSRWYATFGSDAGQKAVGFYHRLRWQKWIKDPQGEPVNLTDADVQAGKATGANGVSFNFTKDDVNVGVIAVSGGESSSYKWTDEMARGKVAMTQWFYNDLGDFQQGKGINPELLGVFPIPAMDKNHHQYIQIQRHFAVMTEGVGRRPAREREACWKVMQALTSPASRDASVRRMVISGRARFVDPDDLRRLGYSDYIKDVPKSLQQLYTGLKNKTVLMQSEPFMGAWVNEDDEVNRNVISLTLADSGEHFDFGQALKGVETRANNGLMFERDSKTLQPYRPGAWTIFAGVLGIILFFVGLIVKANMKAQLKPAGDRARVGVHRPWMPWLLLLPAVGLVALWGYYPLARGLVMAFQDYHIIGKSPWVGIDNFINIFLEPNFYISIRQTLKFVLINMSLVFTAPILLSLMLSEIPYGKIFWRSVFFLPQLTSGLVVVLLWKLIYGSDATGFLNQLFTFFNPKHVPIDWLGNTDTAMICTIIPSVWAGMGISSLIYLAALKGIPDELYEAADLDGAGMWAKLWKITIPQLAPLIIINFIGAFIGTFQSMGNIFLLTFGGPGSETMVLGMAIWKEAYANLRFSTATSMAWVLGSALIGFAYLQIRILRQVEFRRVEEV